LARWMVLLHFALSSRRKRLLTGAVVGLAVGVGTVVFGPPPAAADGSEQEPLSAAPGVPETAPAAPEPAPFSGNVELKARLDSTGRLMIAGERMHVGLLRRFYSA